MNGIQGMNLDDIAHMHGSALSYYIGIGTSYGKRTTMPLIQDFGELEAEMGKMVKGILEYAQEFDRHANLD
jgi:hypothetical protein